MTQPDTPAPCPEFALSRTKGEWLGPIPHDGEHKPDWLPDSAIVMVAFNPRQHQTAMTWEFAEKRKAPAKGRDWEGATAFCVEFPSRRPEPAADAAIATADRLAKRMGGRFALFEPCSTSPAAEPLEEPAADAVEAVASRKPLVWMERHVYGDGEIEIHFYPADSDVGQHIAKYQQDEHGKTVFPLYTGAAIAAMPSGGRS